MTNDVPPPLPGAGSARRTYLGAIGFLFPAVNVWLFATIFLLPRAEYIWQQAGLTHLPARWLIEVPRILKDNGYFVLIFVIALAAILETRVKNWPRYRRRVVAAIVFILNAAVLVGLTLLCIATLLAVPVLQKSH